MGNSYLKIKSVGAGLGRGFSGIHQLKVMRDLEAINGPYGEGWKEDMCNEHNRMVKNVALEAVDKDTRPPETNPVDSTCACKLNSNGGPFKA